jgi:hypothetical protein
MLLLFGLDAKVETALSVLALTGDREPQQPAPQQFLFPSPSGTGLNQAENG